MVKYVEHDKASKARRKNLRVIGTLSKAKAKEFIRNHGVVQVYGTYLDGTVDVAVPLHRSQSKFTQRYYEYWEKRVKDVA